MQDNEETLFVPDLNEASSPLENLVHVVSS